MVGGSRVMSCEPCRKRKRKCDQQRPMCSECKRLKLKCGGYPLAFTFNVLTADAFKAELKSIHGKSAVVGASSKSDPGNLQSCRCSQSDPVEWRDTNLKEQQQQQQGATQNSVVVTHGNSQSFRDGSRSPMFPLKISEIGGSVVSRKAIIAAMQQAYIPKLPFSVAKTGPQFDNGPASTGLWLSNSFELMQFNETPLLQDALLAMSIAFLSNSPEDPPEGNQMQRHFARPIYSIALRRLQHEVSTVDIVNETTRVDACLLASFACAWYEMLGESSLANMRTHMAGVGALLQQLGVRRIRSQTALAILAEYRMTNIWSCLQLRKASFLSSEEWLYRSWAQNDDRPWSKIQILLDIAFVVPPRMEAYDIAVQGSPGGPTAELESSIRDQISAVTGIENALNVWAGSETRPGKWRPSVWNVDGPNNRYFAYTNLSEALAWTYYFAVKLVVLNLLSQMKMVLISRDVYEAGLLEEDRQQHFLEFGSCTEAIFTSMEYFYERDQGYAGPGVSMVPFLIAFKYTAELAAQSQSPKELRDRLAWCMTVRQRYLKLGFPV